MIHSVEQNTSIEDKNKNENMIHDQVMSGELTNETTNEHINEIEENSCKKNET